MQNIFIVGAAKAGTTTLYQLLSQHPAICCPIVKEPNYFSSLDKKDPVKPGSGPGDRGTVWTKDYQQYESLFKLKNEHSYRIDASVSYLYSQHSAAAIARQDPEAKIIIILRNPVERAWSHYKHMVRDGRETETFEAALAAEEDRIIKGWEFSWHLKNMGLYGRQIERWLQHFRKDQIAFFLFEDLVEDMSKVLEATASFIGLSPYSYNFTKDGSNKSGVSKSKTVAKMINWASRYKVGINRVIPPSLTHSAVERIRSLNVKKSNSRINQETRYQLMSYFSEDIQQTEELIGRDLNAWK